MYVTISQSRTNGTQEVLVEDFPLIWPGDLDQALDEARRVSVINDGGVYPIDVTRRDIILTA